MPDTSSHKEDAQPCGPGTLMTDTADGRRMPGGDWHPAVRPDATPIWKWPPHPVHIFKFFFGNPGYRFPWNVIFARIAIVTWLYTQSELSRMAAWEIGWIAHIFIRNLVLLILFMADCISGSTRSRPKARTLNITPNGGVRESCAFCSAHRFWTI